MKLITTIITGLAAHCAMAHASEKPFPKTDKYVVAVEKKQTSSLADIKRSYPELSAFVRNGYTAYRVTYKTKGINGEALVASGALFLPDQGDSFPLLTYNHGTYFPSKEYNAPSYVQGGAELNIGKLFAANGYVVAMPDYIGYGATKKERHPYGAWSFSANTCIDMLLAVKEYCNAKQVQLSGKTFFSGWSEGAAVSLACVKELEASDRGIRPTGAVLNAGPYFNSGMVNYVLDATGSLSHLNSYLWVLNSYNWIYNINRPLHYYYTQPAADRLARDPEASVTQTPAALFTQEFRSDFSGGKNPVLLQAIADNDLWNWTPASKIVFCHGDRDDYVPLFNSEKAYAEMKKNNADVTLRVLKGHSHSSGVFNYLLEAFQTFEGLR